MARPKTKPVKPTTCGVCSHPERARIEALRAGGASYRTLTAKFGVSKDILCRHWRGHVHEDRRAALIIGPSKIEELAGRAAEEGRSLYDYLSIARSVLFNSFLNAAEVGDRAGVAALANRLLECLREVGRLTGDLREASATTTITNNIAIVTTPEFVALQSGLLAIARAHPDARADIVSLLRGLDARPTPVKPNGAHPPLIINGEANHA